MYATVQTILDLPFQNENVESPLPSPPPERGKRYIVARSTQPEITCAICNKPVDLENTKTDGFGEAVHEECYVLKHTTEPATRPPAS
jgi:hypothetical protein